MGERESGVVLRSQHFMSSDVLTASRCSAAQTVTYFLLFFSVSLSYLPSPPSFRSLNCLIPSPSLLRFFSFFQGVVSTFQLLKNGADGCKISRGDIILLAHSFHTG